MAHLAMAVTQIVRMARNADSCGVPLWMLHHLAKSRLPRLEGLTGASMPWNMPSFASTMSASVTPPCAAHSIALSNAAIVARVLGSRYEKNCGQGQVSRNDVSKIAACHTPTDSHLVPCSSTNRQVGEGVFQK